MTWITGAFHWVIAAICRVSLPIAGHRMKPAAPCSRMVSMTRRWRSGSSPVLAMSVT